LRRTCAAGVGTTCAEPDSVTSRLLFLPLRRGGGSGRGGRIRSRDLPRHDNAAAAAGREVPFSNMRKQIARRLTASYQEIPHYNVQIDVFVDALLAARKAFNAAGGRKTSINDWLVRAVALSLIEHPDININVHDESIAYFDEANVAIAVAIDGGLITPVLQQAQRLSVDQISLKVADLAQRARDGQLVQEDMNGGSFTMSNLGMFGVSRFTAIINPPQGAILAVGSARPVPTERDGRIVFGQQMTLTLGCDHRAIDGAMAGRFLSTLRDHLEQPESLLG
jgi:pyruvate dehydrogenase E2 component (dihydrolipoamide acetyltransferase)